MRTATKEFDNEYLQVMHNILNHGVDSPDRTGTGRRRLFDQTMKFDISEEFPLLTTKKVNFKAVVNELVWMVSLGSTDVAWLNEQGHTFWDEWKLEDGTIGKGYGKQFRDCKGVDQISSVLSSLKEDPYGTRHVISLWQPDEIPEMALPPCHGVHVQFFVEDDQLSCKMIQRSGDWFLGVPFNIAFYSLLTKVLAQLTGLKAKEMSMTVIDAHLYKDHLTQAKKQLSRVPKPYPTVEVEVQDINNLRWEDVTVKNYDPHPHIKAPISA